MLFCYTRDKWKWKAEKCDVTQFQLGVEVVKQYDHNTTK